VSDLGLVLALLAAFWTGTNAVFTGMKDVNEIRDRIISGNLSGVPLTSAERQRILWWDWMPFKLSLAFISAVLGVVILMGPRFLSSSTNIGTFRAVCGVAAATPFLGAVYQVVSFVSDARYLRLLIKAGPRAPNSV
jgi:hypothetical protein